MAKKKPVKPTPPPKDETPPRIPAQTMLLDFLKKWNMDFAVRKQQVRYLEDKGILIEPPVIIVYYRDQFDQSKIVSQADDLKEPKLDLPKNAPSKA